MNEQTEWREDFAGALRYAQTHARQLKYPPHWLRCDFMKGDVRCCKGSGHDKAHEEPKLADSRT